MTTVKNVYDFINSVAPFVTQEDWDNAGLLIGNPKKEVKTCLVTLDVTNEILAFAMEKKVDLIVSHHPVIFSPLKSLLAHSLPYQLVQADIAVISAHTNYDLAADGINDALANALDLQDVVSGAEGAIRIGTLPTEMIASDFAKMIKEKLNVNALRYSDTDWLIRKVAVCGGAGSDYLDAAATSADAFVTGDASYHTLLSASQNGFCLVSAGHYETEIIGTNALEEKLRCIFSEVSFIKTCQRNPILTV